MNLKTVYEFIVVINVLLILLFIFEEKKNYRSMLLWVVLFIFFPLGGYLIYLLIGRGILLPSFYYRENEINLTLYNNVTFFNDGRELFKDIFYLIENAKTSIHIESYIFRDDELGKRLVCLLKKKCKEGIKVKVVYDPNGNLFNDKHFFDELINEGGEVRKYYYGIYRFLNFNYRNHRKIIVIDGLVAYIGGFNIGEEYLSKHPRITPWRDSHIKIEGESVYYIQKTFLNDFYSASKKRNVNVNSSLIRSKVEAYCPIEVATFFPNEDYQVVKQVYLKEIYNARKRILIQTPYFVPDIGLLNSLKYVLRQGIEVVIMIPKVYDKIISYYATLEYAMELFEKGAKVYLYHGFIHSKVMLVDSSFLSIGSTNFDIRSFHHNLEENAFIYDRNKIMEYYYIFKDDLIRCDEYDEVYERKYLRKYRFGRKIFKILSSLM